MCIFVGLPLGFSFARFGLLLPLLLSLLRLLDLYGHQRPLFMSRLSARQHRYHRYLLLLYRVRVRGSLVLVDHCGVFVVCVACSWFTCSVLVVFALGHDRGVCSVLVVCSYCGLFVLVVCMMYLWCVRALGLLVLVVCVTCSWRARARGLLALVVCVA